MVRQRLHRGAVLHLLKDPAELVGTGMAESTAYEYYPSGELLVEGGEIIAVGPLGSLAAAVDASEVIDHGSSLILPGFVDCHVHYPQLDVIASYGEQLLEWLDRYVFPEEAKFADAEFARKVAQEFLDELLRNGTTTALVFGTVHAQSVEVFFQECEKRNLRMIAGKVLMDRNVPEALRDSPESAYEDSKELIERWHGRGRLRYAVTPRFAPTSSPEQLAAAGRLLQEYPDVYMHTHMSENRDEIQWVEELFPAAEHYLDVYDGHGLARRRSVFAHCIHLQQEEWARLGASGSSIAFCPSSNLFLGSGLFSLNKAKQSGIPVGLGSDIGAGTGLSCFHTMDAAYKTQQLQQESLSPLQNLYLATLGGAAALDLDDTIGNFQAGKEADFIIVDLAATPSLKRRLERAATIEEQVFVLATLADDRVIKETWIMGEKLYERA
ncbi:MAG: guanine deaminase [Pseudomonadota bacterium]